MAAIHTLFSNVIRNVDAPCWPFSCHEAHGLSGIKILIAIALKLNLRLRLGAGFKINACIALRSSQRARYIDSPHSASFLNFSLMDL